MAALMTSEFSGPNNYSIVFEDNGIVAYSYLLRVGEIVSDVWLYNRTAAPLERPWKAGVHPPYLNPVEYCRENTARLPDTIDDVKIEWQQQGPNTTALVKIVGILFATLSSSEKPGRALLAAKDGPLARVLGKTAMASTVR